eukprot:scaffold17315_cov123-Amphora_coffeaeformis.AAC.1
MLCLTIVSVKPLPEDGCVSSTSQGRRILLMYSPNLTYIEPLLFWKGETSDAPSGSPNPEGSITSPGHETPLASGVSNRCTGSPRNHVVHEVRINE